MQDSGKRRKVIVMIAATLTGTAVFVGCTSMAFWAIGQLPLSADGYWVLPIDALLVTASLISGALGSFIAYWISRSIWPSAWVTSLAMALVVLIIVLPYLPMQ